MAHPASISSTLIVKHATLLQLVVEALAGMRRLRVRKQNVMLASDAWRLTRGMASLGAL